MMVIKDFVTQGVTPSTYTSGEQEQFVELSSFNVCSILQS
jgi:hypothetical protein